MPAQLASVRLAREMLVWTRGDLVGFVTARSGPDGAFELTEVPCTDDVEIEATRDGASWRVRAVNVPAVRVRGDDPDATYLATAIARRAETMAALLRAALESSATPTAADLADTLYMPVALVERMVRAHVARVDDSVIHLATLVDLDGVVTTSRRDESFAASFSQCQQSYGVGDAALYEWPNNVISARAVVYEGGIIARDSDEVVVRYLPKERALAEDLAGRAAAILGEFPVGMGSESDDYFSPFWCLALPERSTPPPVLDEASIRTLFGGTLSPHDPIVVEPMSEASEFFRDFAQGAADPEAVDRLRNVMTLFTGSLAAPAFVSIGFFEHAPAVPLDAAARPPGFESRGSCLPRLILGLTEAGSAVGLFGHVVWS